MDIFYVYERYSHGYIPYIWGFASQKISQVLGSSHKFLAQLGKLIFTMLSFDWTVKCSTIYLAKMPYIEWEFFSIFISISIS